jgi:hypothetical protein
MFTPGLRAKPAFRAIDYARLTRRSRKTRANHLAEQSLAGGEPASSVLAESRRVLRNHALAD